MRTSYIATQNQTKMRYFGTALDRSGHYVWEISEDGRRLRGGSLSGLSTIDFDPETIGKENSKNRPLKKGDVIFCKSAHFTICYIEGSCYDKRPGTKSVFWVEGIISFEDLKEKILSTPIAIEMFNKMPFKTNWESHA